MLIQPPQVGEPCFGCDRRTTEFLCQICRLSLCPAMLRKIPKFETDFKTKLNRQQQERYRRAFKKVRERWLVRAILN